MSEATLAETPTIGPPRAVKVPPTPRLPKFIQAIAFVMSRRTMVARTTSRLGEVFTLEVPVFGPAVIVADPLIAKQLFTANTDDVGNIQPNLSRILGSG